MTLKEPQPAHTFSKDAANPSLCPLDFASDTGAGREALTWFIPCFGPHLGVDPSVCISACQRAMCSCPSLAFVLCLDVRCAPTEALVLLCTTGVHCMELSTALYRRGGMCAQTKALCNAMGSLWTFGKLDGKLAACSPSACLACIFIALCTAGVA